MFILDYGIRTARECVTDGIAAMAREIQSPVWFATGDALSWAESANDYVERYLGTAPDDESADMALSEMWDTGSEYLYATTGLHAVEDDYSGGLHFLTDAELEAWSD